MMSPPPPPPNLKGSIGQGQTPSNAEGGGKDLEKEHIEGNPLSSDG